VDGKRIYVAVNNYLRRSFTLAGTNQKWAAGSWAALDVATGNIVWQVPATGQNPLVPAEAAGALGPITTVNGVVLAGSLSGDMVALDASTGKTLWKFASGGSVASSPSVAGDSIYWGSGYARYGFGTGNNKLFAFHLPGSP
jgi:polyvinyl alcohol dehydrogenase (cytochrome)